MSRKREWCAQELIAKKLELAELYENQLKLVQVLSNE